MPLITFEGIDGAGKSTVLGCVYEQLVEAGQHVRSLSDFNSCPVARLLKPLMIGEMNPWAQYALVTAARVVTHRTVVRDALAAKQVVLYDRYLDSTHAYQGSLGVDVNRIARDHAECGLPIPDLVIVLDLPVAAARFRKGSAGDRMESLHDSFFEVVRNAYQARGKQGGRRYAVVDANRPINAVVAECMSLIQARVITPAVARVPQFQHMHTMP